MTLTETDLRRIEQSPRPRVLLRQLRLSTARVRGREEAAQIITTTYQRSLRIIDPRTGGLIETDRVPCRMGGMLLVRACLVLRSRTWPSGRRKGKPVRLECIGCPLGIEYAKRLPGFQPPPASQAAEVLSPEQRAARAKWKATHETEEQGRLDPLYEAAMLTPDDSLPR